MSLTAQPEDSTPKLVPSVSRIMKSDSFDTSSNPPESHQSFSLFGDAACGEPLCAQRLLLDFTPIEKLDTDFVQKKCCAFWDLLQTRTDLQQLMVLPENEINEVNASVELEEPSQSRILEVDAESELKEATAVSMLEFVEGKGLIDRTFEAKLPQSMCSLGSREYLELSVRKSASRNKEGRKKREGFATRPGPIGPPSKKLESTPEVQLLCGKMREWDEKHPKSMVPPGHCPALSHCVMQRKECL